MLKYVAKQVPPEYQCSDILERLEDMGEERIAIIAPRGYADYIPARAQKVIDALERQEFLDDYEAYKDAVESGDSEAAVLSWYDSLPDVAQYYFRDRDDFRPHAQSMSEEDAARLHEIAGKYADHADADLIADALSVLEGETWEAREIRGCCQGDYATILFSASAYYDGMPDEIESEYFNTGSEWKIFPADEDEPECNIYAHAWDAAGIADEIATAMFCRPDEIELWSFDGWTRSAQYSRVDGTGAAVTIPEAA